MTSTISPYLTSWGYYHSGRPLGTYADATILGSVGPVSKRVKYRSFVDALAVKKGLERQKTVKTVDPKAMFPAPVLLEVDTKQWAVDEPDEPLALLLLSEFDFPVLSLGQTTASPPPPSPPPGKTTKRKRAVIPDDTDDNDDDEIESVRAPKRAKSGGMAAVRHETDEGMARRLDAEQNGRRTRQRV